MEKEKLEIDPIMSKILKHAESQLLEGSLIREDGKPNFERINTLFRKYDNDNNNKISRNELEQIINTVQFENLHPKSEDVVNKIFFNFDKDGSNMIETEEFVKGLQNWLAKAIRVAKCSDKTKSVDKFDKIYSRVVMNNISGLTTLLAVVYAKDLPWDYSAEVLTILVVCAIVGILGVSRTEYPFWTCLLAFFLYPFSLALYCFVELVLHWN
ncbi:sodium calcium exchanger NCL-like [Olea europaea subsp. europaea]|uniref:Sodium calcium exchanger NCL-like n=1 Tax=Olea europaea subsp. europaea TaxID=158383 RepID=A0A8S0V959_OLEEU|nr:sodium calcium exchanger NCL-like [Olea europaea subsp. europaea]